MKVQSLTVQVMEGLHSFFFFHFPLGLEVRAGTMTRVMDYFARKETISINICNQVCEILAPVFLSNQSGFVTHDLYYYP